MAGTLLQQIPIDWNLEQTHFMVILAAPSEEEDHHLDEIAAEEEDDAAQWALSPHPGEQRGPGGDKKRAPSRSVPLLCFVGIHFALHTRIVQARAIACDAVRIPANDDNIFDVELWHIFSPWPVFPGSPPVRSFAILGARDFRTAGRGRGSNPLTSCAEKRSLFY